MAVSPALVDMCTSKRIVPDSMRRIATLRKRRSAFQGLSFHWLMDELSPTIARVSVPVSLVWMTRERRCESQRLLKVVAVALHVPHSLVLPFSRSSPTKSLPTN
jgi:hypothetical protein